MPIQSLELAHSNALSVSSKTSANDGYYDDPGFQTIEGISTASDKVAILLCTMQGQSYLAEQLDSIGAQHHANWVVFASDDGSRDRTFQILDEYRSKWGSDRISVHFGPAEGFAANFLSLICKASIQADYYAFADQDDIWEHDKLARAVRWLQQVPPDVPALYCSRTRLINESGQDIGFSPLHARRPSFANALVQNLGGGNTMVFNDTARKLICAAGEGVKVVAHDWWAYMVVAGCGGQVFYDPVPTVRYRQHDLNTVGFRDGWAVRLERLTMLLKGRFKGWNDLNFQALNLLRAKLTAENRQALDELMAIRQRTVFGRMLAMLKSGIYRQTALDTAALYLAAVFNKI